TRRRLAPCVAGRPQRGRPVRAVLRGPETEEGRPEPRVPAQLPEVPHLRGTRLGADDGQEPGSIRAGPAGEAGDRGQDRRQPAEGRALGGTQAERSDPEEALAVRASRQVDGPGG